MSATRITGANPYYRGLEIRPDGAAFGVDSIILGIDVSIKRDGTFVTVNGPRGGILSAFYLDEYDARELRHFLSSVLDEIDQHQAMSGTHPDGDARNN